MDLISSEQHSSGQALCFNGCCRLELADQPPYTLILTSVSQREKTLGLKPLSQWWCHVCCSWHFFSNKIKSSSPIEPKHCKLNRKHVWTTRETMLKGETHLVTFCESIMMSLWTLQPTHIYVSVCMCCCMCECMLQVFASCTLCRENSLLQ